jgi:DNA-nicking Smr family endonuclease
MTRRNGSLTPDEEALWRHVVDRVPMLQRQRPKPAGETTVPQPTSQARVPANDTPPADPQPRRWQPLITTPTPRPQPTTSGADGFDRKRLKRIATGRLEIEGRIDLHGLRENEAHLRLRGFLRQAHAQGKRTVLVITGKGRDEDDPYAPFDFGADRSPRGVLKRNVPRWLSEPDLTGIVVSFAPAHVRHGGEGALYVHLRRH